MLILATNSTLFYTAVFTTLMLVLALLDSLTIIGLKRALGDLPRRFSWIHWAQAILIALLVWVDALFIVYGFFWLSDRPEYIGTLLPLTGVWGVLLAFKVTVVVATLLDLGASAVWKLIRPSKVPPPAPTAPRTVNPGDSEPISRRHFIAQLGGLAGLLPAAAVLNSILVGRYNYQLHRPALHVPTLPSAFDGLKILQLSDFHIGSFQSKEAVRKGVDLAMAQEADLIVFTGDLVNNLADEMAPYADMFAQLDAPMGKFAVTGNHDYGDYAEWESNAAYLANQHAIFQMFETAGFRLLLNEHTVIRRGGQRLNIIGPENWGTHVSRKYGDLSRSVFGLEYNDTQAFNLLLAHDPTFWEAKALPHPLRFDLMLSGHTHGMQCGVDTNELKWSPIQYIYPQWAGLYSRGDQHLYVNRGFGFSRFPGRLGVLPEITVLTLRRGGG
jgi:predicted MPP superfamily phosphohydrolase